MAVLRRLGRPVATIVGAILVATAVVRGESWAIQQAPLLLSDSSIVASTEAGCVPFADAGASALPVAILH